jgi:YidC/Oxa1 family membrane protein insertase
MEHIRLIAAIILSLLIFLVWDFVFVDRQPAPPSSPPAQTERQPAEPGRINDNGRVWDQERTPIPDATHETISIETGLYSAAISPMGAAIVRFDLKEYREHSAPDAPPKSLIAETNRIGTAIVELSGTDEPLSRALFSTNFKGQALKVANQPETISFFWQSDNGVMLEKRYTFYPDTYNIDMSIQVRNESGDIVDRSLLISMINPPPEDGRTFSFSGPFIYMDRDLHEIAIKDIAGRTTFSGNIQWTGQEDHYFMTALIPETPTETNVVLDLNRQTNLLHVTFEQPLELLAPGQVSQHDYHLFMGPKKLSLLREFGYDLQEVVDFGFFGIISKPALLLMNWIHDNIIANYGVAIIILTLLIKAAFWPLGNKSYKSMAEMRKLQPLMMDIRNKYKDDKRKMNEEVMGLYKTYKINPLSGCLPMLVQIPVFIAFYRMLYEAIELRHAPFMLWINDLSVPDRLFDFGFSIPFMAQPTGIPVLTLIMGASMFLQQKLAPPPGDPMQAKIMMMLPIVFTVIFINFPAGLVLYWLVNNLVSIAQQYNINRKMI